MYLALGSDREIEALGALRHYDMYITVHKVRETHKSLLMPSYRFWESPRPCSGVLIH